MKGFVEGKGGGGGGVVTGTAPIHVDGSNVAITPADATHDGSVTQAAQTFAGDKTFNDGATIASGAMLFQQQGGTLTAPTTETPIRFQPRDPALGVFEFTVLGSVFHGVVDPVMQWGYNYQGGQAAEPGAGFAIEGRYIEPVGQVNVEIYSQINKEGFPGGTGLCRPIFSQYIKGTDQVSTIIGFRSGGQGSCNIQDALSGNTVYSANETSQNWSIGPTQVMQIDGNGGLTLPLDNFPIRVGTNPPTHGIIRLGAGSPPSITSKNAASGLDVVLAYWEDGADTLHLGVVAPGVIHPPGKIEMAGPVQFDEPTVGVTGGVAAIVAAAGVGGAGQPTTAAQAGWLKARDATGATIWIPYWK